MGITLHTIDNEADRKRLRNLTVVDVKRDSTNLEGLQGALLDMEKAEALAANAKEVAREADEALQEERERFQHLRDSLLALGPSRPDCHKKNCTAAIEGLLSSISTAEAGAWGIEDAAAAAVADDSTANDSVADKSHARGAAGADSTSNDNTDSAEESAEGEGTTAADSTTHAAVTSSTTTSTCFGYTVCPEYPLPYSHGQWPATYNYSGSFPDGFVWGLGTASYQIEGAFREGGRGASIWDTFTGANTIGMPGADCSYCCESTPCAVNGGMTTKGATGNVACDHYHLWRSDVALMQSMGLKHYRFSIAWPRIVPTGRIADGVNEEGIAFYSELLDALIAAGIEPWATLYHWDLPQGLLNPPYANGWWSRDEDGQPNGEILNDWMGYVETCFSRFGDRVKMWFTFNEAWTSSFLGSGSGMAPSIKEFNDQSIDPYIAAHNMLIAHASAVDLYRKKFKKKQRGKIGITNNCDWHEPASESSWDIAAARRAVDFQLGWFADPIFSGTADYPEAMRRLLGDRLPAFTEEQKKLINGSSDFFGLNHYGTSWTAHLNDTESWDGSFVSNSEDGFPKSQSMWLYGSGWGFRKMLNHIDRVYHHPPIFVTEGGWSLAAESEKDGVVDPERTMYYANYTAEMQKAIYEDGVDIRGYFGWSLMDNFEWAQGYVERFGVTYTDFRFGWDSDSPWISDDPDVQAKTPTADGQRRFRKASSCWLEKLWSSNALVDPIDFTGCVESGVFVASFQDPSRKNCTWTVVPTELSPAGGNGTIRVSGSGCAKRSVLATFHGGAVNAEFGKKGKSKLLTGYWSRADGGAIIWEDGTSWRRITSSRRAKDMDDVASILRPNNVSGVRILMQK